MSSAIIDTKIANLADPTELKKAPDEAFRFEAGPLAFDSVTEASDQSVPVKLLARTAEPLDHWYWGRIVHDFEGMTHRDKIPLDYRHRGDDLVGYLNKFEVRDGNLHLAGSIESIEAGDEASRLIARGRRGIPYQSSIYFDDRMLEFVPEGFTASVNGLSVEGPLVIVREWELRGCAITPYGHDPGTAAQFSASQEGTRQLSWKKGSPMSKDTAANSASQTTETTPAAETTAGKPAAAGQLEAPAVEVNVSGEMSEARKELARYLEKFGPEHGAKYFSDGLSFEKALSQGFDQRGEQIKKLEEELASEKQKLAAAQLEHGEREPVSTGSASTQKKGGMSSLFRKAG